MRANRERGEQGTENAGSYSGPNGDVQADIERIRDGLCTRGRLLTDCLDGANDDCAQGWRDYVEAVVEASAPVRIASTFES
jgi:hypothetical protein